MDLGHLEASVTRIESKDVANMADSSAFTGALNDVC